MNTHTHTRVRSRMHALYTQIQTRREDTHGSNGFAFTTTAITTNDGDNDDGGRHHLTYNNARNNVTKNFLSNDAV